MATDSTYSLTCAQGLWRCEFSAMASPCEVLCESEDADWVRSLAAFATAEAQRIERKFSRYRTDSVVHRINTSHGTAVRVDDETARLIAFGASLWELSEGRFDITSGVLRHAWRFDAGQTRPDSQQIRQLLERVGWQRVTWQPPWLTLPAGMEIDFGGIGKEYAVDRIADWAAARSTAAALVNLGGDLRCVGAPPRSGAWQVGVESVRRLDQVAARIELRAGGLATSGDSRRHVLIDGRRYGHILDARTGWPAEDAPHSVTVAAATCSQAGSLSTLAMLLGKAAEEFLAAQDIRYWCMR